MRRLILLLLALSLTHCVPVDDMAHGDFPKPDSGISPKGVNTNKDTSAGSSGIAEDSVELESGYTPDSSDQEVSRDPQTLWCIKQQITVCSEMRHWVSEGWMDSLRYRWLCLGPGRSSFKCE